MASVPIRLVKSSIQFRYSAPADLLDRVRAEVGGSGPLYLNHQASNVSRLLLQTATSSTLAEIRQETSAMVTTYFGPDFTSPGEAPERVGYAREKLSALLTILRGNVDAIDFIGAMVEAKISANEVDPGQLLDAASKTFDLRGLLSEEAPCFDFELRVSRTIEPDLFSNLRVAWYESRQAEVMLGKFEAGAALPPNARSSISEWEMRLADQGMTLSYDRNNKRGLRQGKTEWGEEDVLRVYVGALDDFPAALAPIVSKLRFHLST